MKNKSGVHNMKAVAMRYFLTVGILLGWVAMANAQTTYYVNDNSLTGDVFTTAVGNNANAGTAAAPFLTISFAIAQAVDGDLIIVDAGTYNEDASTSTGLNTGKKLSFTGAVDVNNNPVSILVGSLYLNDNDGQSITNMRFEAAGVNIYLVSIRNVDGMTFTNCVFDGNNQFMLTPSKDGINYENGLGVNTNILVQNCRFIDGLYVAINSRFRNLRVTNSIFSNVKSGINHYGADSLRVENCEISVIAQAIIADSYCIRFGVGTNNPTAFMNVSNCKMVVNTNGLTAAPGYYHCALWTRTSALSPLDIHDCSIIGNLVNTSATPINATCNYWGNPCGPQPGQIISTLGAVVTTSPFIFNGTDNSLNTGFQPVSGSCTVTPLSLSTIVTNVNCYGQQDGAIDLTVSGGIPPYQYLWSNGSTTQDLSTLGPGTYQVTVTDACGATATTSAQVIQPSPINLSVTSTNPTCPVGCFGTITATATTGAVITVNGNPYNPSFQYPTGTYVVIATIPNGNGTGFCSKDTTIIIAYVAANAKYLVVDVVANRAFYYDANFNFILSNLMQSPPLSGTSNAQDVVWNGSNYVYVLDGVARRVYRSSQTGTIPTISRELRTNTGAGLNPLTGIQVRGNELLVIDKKSRALYVYNLAQAFNGSPAPINATQRVNLVLGSSEALAYDGTYFYILNNSNQSKSIYRYDLTGNTATLQSRLLFTNTGADLIDATGAVVDGSLIWITDRGTDRAYSYNIASLFAGTTGLNALNFRPLNVGNTSATGITLINTTTLLRKPDEGKISRLSVNAYPNPSDGTFRLVIGGIEKGNEISVSVTDLRGRVVESRLIDSEIENIEQLFELKGVQKGMYFVHVVQNENRETIKVLLQ